MNPEQQYESTANALVERFLSVIKAKPELANCNEPFDFFNHGLTVSDLEPSLFQAQWAMRKAQAQFKLANHQPMEPPQQ